MFSVLLPLVDPVLHVRNERSIKPRVTSLDPGICSQRPRYPGPKCRYGIRSCSLALQISRQRQGHQDMDIHCSRPTLVQEPGTRQHAARITYYRRGGLIGAPLANARDVDNQGVCIHGQFRRAIPWRYNIFPFIGLAFESLKKRIKHKFVKTHPSSLRIIRFSVAR